MIYIEVTKSSDPTAIGLYDFCFDTIYIGRSKKSDLIILDQNCPLHYLELKIINNQLIIKNFKNQNHFFINGKKVSGTLKLKTRDIISFGKESFTIKDFSSTQNIQVDITELYSQFKAKHPELEFSLKTIEKIIIELEAEESPIETSTQKESPKGPHV